MRRVIRVRRRMILTPLWMLRSLGAGFWGGVLAFGSGATVFGSGLFGSAGTASAAAHAFPFTPIGIATDFEVHVPEGYSWKPLVRWGDPLFSEAKGAYSAENGVSVEMSDKVFGENTDGMELFNIDGREILAINSEYVNPKINLPAASDGVPQSADEVTLLKNLQGVTVLEVADQGNGTRLSSTARTTGGSPMKRR